MLVFAFGVFYVGFFLAALAGVVYLAYAFMRTCWRAAQGRPLL